MVLLTKDMHKEDILKFLEGKGDFVQIDYLNRYVKLIPPIEMRKFAYLKLAEIYLKKEMFSDAAESFRNAGINAIILSEKQKYYLEEAKAEILDAQFDKSEKALKRAMDEANQKEKEILYQEIIKFYKSEADKNYKLAKKGKAVQIYEKLIRMKISEEEKQEVKKRLLELYEKLGKIREYQFLKEH